MEIDHFQTWVGRKEVRNEIVTFNQAAQLAALFDWPAPPQKGDILPYLWHWANVFPPRRQSELGPDGHPTRGG